MSTISIRNKTKVGRKSFQYAITPRLFISSFRGHKKYLLQLQSAILIENTLSGCTNLLSPYVISPGRNQKPCQRSATRSVCMLLMNTMRAGNGFGGIFSEQLCDFLFFYAFFLWVQVWIFFKGKIADDAVVVLFRVCNKEGKMDLGLFLEICFDTFLGGWLFELSSH